MFKFLKPKWLQGIQHPSDETLLGYLDGEIGSRRARSVAAHLDTCWACRRRRDRFESGIDLIMDARPASDQPVTPPHGWSGFEQRLARERRDTDPFQDLFTRWSLVPGLSVRLASVVTTVLVVVGWLYLGSSPALSAPEILRRAGQAREARLAAVSVPVTYQKLSLHRRLPRAGETVATVELWQEAGGPRFKSSGGEGVWQEIERILRANRMDVHAPLGADSYKSWYSSRASVTKTELPDGQAAYSLEDSPAPAGPDSVVRTALLVRSADWHPVQARWEVQTSEGLGDYRVTELAYEVRSLSSFDRGFFGFARPQLANRRIPAPPLLEPADVSGLAALDWSLPRWKDDPESVEMEARYALHRERACLGEAVQILMEPSGDVLVRGLVQTSERREQLVSALLATPLAKVEIGTLEGAAEKILADGHAAASDAAQHPKLVLPLQKRLEEFFADRGGREAVGNAITDLSNQAVSQAEDMLAQAWALRHLEQAYPPERAGRLSARNARLLEQMLREHANALRSAVRGCRATLRPFFSSLLKVDAVAAAPAGEGEEPRISELLSLARQGEGLVSELFAGMTEAPQKPEEPVARLVRTLSALENQTGSLQASLAQGLPRTFTASRR